MIAKSRFSPDDINTLLNILLLLYTFLSLLYYYADLTLGDETSIIKYIRVAIILKNNNIAYIRVNC